MAFTKRRFQHQGCARATGLFLFEEAVKRGLCSLFVDLTTAHIYSQRAAVHAGARECCVLLGVDPEAQSWRHFSSESQRVSNVIAHLRVPSASPGSASHETILYPPRQHREMIAGIYESLGWAPRFAEHASSSGELPKIPSIIEVSTGKAYQQAAVIEVKAFGADVVPEIGRTVKRLCLEKVEVVYLLLDLSDPWTAAVTGEFEDLGFFFAGVLPRPDGADRLELQYLNNVLIDYERIQLYSDFAKTLLAYIRARDPIHHAL